ncbi:hypothetical protein VAR608DRAFT_2881 [Variovorax sp. HW608]|uniref:hypothetical protein n=1 Tax=Variovorax sp. HW608 TaxID=1034889 RepID=UPI00081FE743|nr:hypothetical protein [Variovorax sp. HW608]SCK32758.1 hypothetical protein VAR608DRAFT_2881 [Variovorax sp. HW608]
MAIDSDVLGSVLRSHTTGLPVHEGRVVCVLPDGSALWWIPFPKQGEKNKRLAHHIKSPRRIDEAELERLIKSGEFSLIGAGFPAEWELSDEDLEHGVTIDHLIRKSRAHPAKWLKRRNQHDALIAGIVNEYDAFALLEAGLASELAAQQAGIKNVSPPKIVQLLRRYMLGLGHRNSLLPYFGCCGGLGQSKQFKTKPGRPNIEAKALSGAARKRKLGLNLTERDKENLRAGYQKYKSSDATLEYAYHKTMSEYYAAKLEYTASSKDPEVVYLPPERRPTLAQFELHGPASKRDRPQQINLGVAHYEGHQQPIRHSGYERANIFGLRAYLDSTSEDQTPVSEASRLIVLPTSWRTLVVEDSTDYILGVASGHQHSSQYTGMRALLNCAEGHVEYAAQFSVQIEKDDWINWMPKQVTGDNGDIKAHNSIKTLSKSELSIAFTKLFSPNSKAKVEAGHKTLHSLVDSRNIGATHGRRRKRGDPFREDVACRTHSENMPHLIEGILYHNNVEQVPQYLTLEMRNDGVKPTRKEIVLWKIRKGYIASEPINLDLLRAQCLPRIAAVVHGDGVHLRDPRGTRGELIPGLVYSAEWLYQTDILTRARKKAIEYEAFVDPSNLSQIFIQLNGMKSLDLKARDAELNKVTLVDWLTIASSDKLAAFIATRVVQNAEGSRIAKNDRANQHTMREKQAELNALAKRPSRAARRSGKRSGLAKELNSAKKRDLGLPGNATIAPMDYESALPAKSTTSSQTARMEAIRKSWHR